MNFIIKQLTPYKLLFNPLTNEIANVSGKISVKFFFYTSPVNTSSGSLNLTYLFLLYQHATFNYFNFSVVG